MQKEEIPILDDMTLEKSIEKWLQKGLDKEKAELLSVISFEISTIGESQ